MQFYYILKTKLPILAVLSLFIGVSSCGSYQYASTDNDGIYDSNTRSTQVETVETQPKTTTNGTYYKNYFQEKDQYADINNPDAIFTDIDAYESDYAVETDSIDRVPESYAGWGQANDNVEINVYTRPNFGWGWGWGRPWGGFGYWNNWNLGWGWGWGNVGFYDPFWCSPLYGGFGYGGFWRPWYGNNFYRPYNNFYGVQHNGYRRGLAYNTGRRNSVYGRNTSNLTRRSSVNRSRRSFGRSASSKRITRPNSQSRPRVTRPGSQSRPRVTRPGSQSRPRVTRPGSQSRPRVTRPGSQSRPRVTRPNNSRPRTNNFSRRSSSPSRSFSSPSRSSRSSSRGMSSSRRRG